jgi:hypothetical protein
MRLGLWQTASLLFALSAFGVGVGLLAFTALLLIDIVIQCAD